MKKLMLLCCFILGATAMGFAQGGGRGMMMKPEDRAKQLQTQLKLTDEQTTKVTAIYATQAVKMDSLMKAANGDFSAMRTTMRPMMEASNAKINELLTDVQKAEFKKVQDEQTARMRQGGNGGGGGTPPPPAK